MGPENLRVLSVFESVPPPVTPRHPLAMFCDWCRPIPVISSTSQLTENEPDFLPVGFVRAESWRYAAGTLDGRVQGHVSVLRDWLGRGDG